MDKKTLLMAATKKMLPKVVDTPKPCIDKALGLTNSIDINAIRVPFLTQDEDVKKAIQDFGLENPEKCARFIVEAFFAQFECINENVNQIKQNFFTDRIAKITTGKDLILSGLNNPMYLENKLNAAHDLILQGTNELMMSTLKGCIEDIRKIDNRSAVGFFLKSKMSLSSLDQANHLAKDSIMALIDAYNLQTFIAAKLNLNIDHVHKKFDDFARQFSAEGNDRLLHAYDDEPAEEFWLKVPHTINCIENKETLMLDYFEEIDEISDDNIEF